MPSQKLKALRVRAEMLARTRKFFEERDVLEVDCPILNSATNIDDHIDPIEATFLRDHKGYLHTSPELFLKKLLALEGCDDLFFLGHVFRDHEKGAFHHVEFTMVEWYRKQLSYEELIEETLEFIRLFFIPRKINRISYREAFLLGTNLDYTVADQAKLMEYIHKEIDPSLNWEKDSLEDLQTFLFSEKVEPFFDPDDLTLVYDFPKNQAALSKVKKIEGIEVAKRFEVYGGGVELANGYDELRGSEELLSRYQQLNKKRISLGKKALRIDLEFIQANECLPDCRGVAVGFDRLMMLKSNNHEIRSSMALL
jgi:lysyl-tRNA synthetase class 2